MKQALKYLVIFALCFVLPSMGIAEPTNTPPQQQAAQQPQAQTAIPLVDIFNETYTGYREGQTKPIWFKTTRDRWEVPTGSESGINASFTRMIEKIKALPELQDPNAPHKIYVAGNYTPLKKKNPTPAEIAKNAKYGADRAEYVVDVIKKAIPHANIVNYGAATEPGKVRGVQILVQAQAEKAVKAKEQAHDLTLAIDKVLSPKMDQLAQILLNQNTAITGIQNTMTTNQDQASIEQTHQKQIVQYQLYGGLTIVALILVGFLVTRVTADTQQRHTTATIHQSTLYLADQLHRQNQDQTELIQQGLASLPKGKTPLTIAGTTVQEEEVVYDAVFKYNAVNPGVNPQWETPPAGIYHVLLEKQPDTQWASPMLTPEGQPIVRGSKAACIEHTRRRFEAAKTDGTTAANACSTIIALLEADSISREDPK